MSSSIWASSSHEGEPNSSPSTGVRDWPTNPRSTEDSAVSALTRCPLSASSAGSLVARKCSVGEAMLWNATRWVPVDSNPWPRSAESRNCRSPADRSKVWVISSIACDACRSRIWVAALVTTAFPRSLLRTSAVSWVATVRPAQCLRDALAMRNRNSAPACCCLVHDHQSRAADRRAADSAPYRIQGEQGANRFEFLGQIPQGEHHQVALRLGGGRPVDERPEGALDPGVQPGGQLPCRGVTGGGHDLAQV